MIIENFQVAQFSQGAWEERRGQAARREGCCPAATAQQRGKKMGWIYKEPQAAKL